MACNVTNPQAPNGTPSDLWAQLRANYDLATASAIYTTAESVRQLEEHRYDKGTDLTAAGELTYAAAIRLVTPLLTEQTAAGIRPGNDVIAAIEKKLAQAYEGMRTVMAARKVDRQTRPFDPKINDTADLALRANRMAKTNPLIAFCEIIQYVRGRAVTVSQLTDLTPGLPSGSNGPLDPANDAHYSLVASLRDEMRMYTSPLNMGTLVQQHSGLESELNQLNGEVARVLTQLDDWLDQAFTTRLDQLTSNPELKGNQDALKQATTRGADINGVSGLMQAAGDSSNPLVAMAGNAFRRAQMKWNLLTERFKKDLATVVRDLAQANGGQPKDMYRFMLVFDKDGKATGKYIIPEDDAYFEHLKKIEDTLLDPADPDGKARLQFNTVAAKYLTPAERQHNIDLANKRKVRQKFWEAEQITRTTAGGYTYSDGHDHRYTDEFKAARDVHQVLIKNAKGAPEWVARPAPAGVSAVEWALSQEGFLNQYYEAERETTQPVFDHQTNAYTGEVLIGPARFVKKQYVQVQPQWESAQYQRIMANTQSAKGRAEKAFYEFFLQAQNHQSLRKLPPSQRMNFYGDVPRVRKNRATSAAESIRGGAKNLLKTLKPNIDLNVYTRSRAVDQDGKYLEGIPVYLVGGLKSQAQVDAAQADYDALRQQRRLNPRDKSLQQQEESARQKLSAAKSAIEADDLELDMGRSLLTFFEMAEEYHQLKQSEPLFQQVLGLVEEMKFLNTDNMGKPIPDAQGQHTYGEKGQSSNTWKQFRSFLDLNVYNSVRADSLAERISDGVLRWSGSLMQAFNVGSQINELVSGNINQFLEGRWANKFGATGFLKPGEYFKAQSEVIGGTMKEGAHEIMRLFNEPDLLDRPHDKVSAMMEQLFIRQNVSNAGSLKTGNLFADIGYKPLNVFEFYTQATLAVARMRSVDVPVLDAQGNPTLDAEGNPVTKTLWDSLEFNQATGELVVPDHIKDDELMGHVIQIRSMISAIHGNYSERDRVAIQRYMLGRLAYQFKKWAYQLGRARWGEEYYDEGIQAYREGRYRTVARFLSQLHLTGFKVRDQWATLDAREKINIAKTASDLAMFAGLLGVHALLGAAAGDDDDDEALTHRLVNFISKQAHRSSMEVSAGFNPLEWAALLKNPLPILRSLENTAAVLSDFTGVGAYLFTGDEQDIIVQRGMNRGDYKLQNSILKLIPGGLLKGQWQQSAMTPKYFIPK